MWRGCDIGIGIVSLFNLDHIKFKRRVLENVSKQGHAVGPVPETSCSRRDIILEIGLFREILGKTFQGCSSKKIKKYELFLGVSTHSLSRKSVPDKILKNS